MRPGIFARAMRRHRADYLWPFEILARRLAAGGHDVTVFTTALPDGTGARFDDGGVSVHHLEGTRPERIDAAFHAASAAARHGTALAQGLTGCPDGRTLFPRRTTLVEEVCDAGSTDPEIQGR